MGGIQKIGKKVLRNTNGPCILCVSDDQLALHHIDVHYMPASLWTDSVNHVTFGLSAVNLGSDIAQRTPAVTFNVELYLSADDVLDTDTDRLSPALKDENGLPYDGFNGGLYRGEVAVLPALIGNYFIVRLNVKLT